MRALAALALVALAAGRVAAGTEDCAESTLGALTRAAEAIALAEERGASGPLLRLHPVRFLKGPELEALHVLAGEDGPPRGAGRLLVFLARQDGVWEALELIRLGSAEEAQALTAAVRQRLAGGEPEPLFAQLLSPAERVACDAALELSELPALRPDAAARALLRRALAERPSLELLLLAQRLAGPDLAQPLIELARAAPHPLLQAQACLALAASDRAAGLRAFAPEAERGALVAIRAVGRLGGPEAEALLARALRAEARPAQRLALVCALVDCRAEDPAPLTAVARAPLAPAEARFALAALARCGQGRALKTLHQELADPALRELTRALRRDPVDLAKRVLDEAEAALAAIGEEEGTGNINRE